ncbi:DUF4012 domain-containing protein [Aeromicrobium sp. A1-2]|uniref:DUF4012 domain-containing protein n=1 Tax=Aeromicrobium sp. A1-2 TaxID=2107713 RepID=UPI0013C2D39B|nr:DUF4012 domain-containing protein [Aeromicrobium sp. A1-2]
MRIGRFGGRTRYHHHRPWYQRITRVQVGWGVLGLIVVLLAAFGLQARQASSSLRLAANQAEVLQSQIVAGDDVGAKATLVGLQESAAEARSRTDGILWIVGSHVPYFGKNVSAVQTVADVIDQISQEAMPPVVKLSKQVNLNTFSPRDGKVDLAAINEIRPSIAAADEALAAANDKLVKIDADSLLVPIRGPVATIQNKIATAGSAASSSRTAAQLLPSMLGGKDTRRYLLLIQNNAEVRPTGGIAGSFAILKAKNGKLSMGEQGSTQDLPPVAKPVIPMTKDEKTVFPTTLVTDLRDANITPDFPRTGEITRALVKKGLGVDVDGVISVDPIALSYVLGGTGPVTVDNGAVIDQSNAVSTLLNRLYRQVQDNDEQDDFFASAARKIFDVVKSGDGQSRVVISALVAAANENRLTVWSSHEDEQREIRTTNLSGAVGGDDGETPHVGVYLSDAASTKMEFYLDYTTILRTGRCLRGDVQELSTTTELRSNAPSNADRLSPYVTGTGAFTPRGTMRISVRAYSPFDGGFTEVRVNGKKQTVYADRHLGRNVTSVTLVINPGETYTVTTSMISGRGQRGDAVFSTTPGVQQTLNNVRVQSACG